MARLALRVLGGFEVEGIDQHSVGSRKARKLLRLLALARGRPVATADLADALWGTSPPARPADQVAVLASRLRRVLGRERIEHAEHGYRLTYDRLDADELASVSSEIRRRQEAGNRSGAAAAARLALSLIRADIPAEDDDPAWALEEVAQLRASVRRARRLAAVALLETGSWLEAADLAEADLRHDPFDEDAVRLLMRANVVGGRPGVALAAYADLCDRLADELGADPAPETADLHADVLRGGSAAPVARTSARSGFVGRDAQLAHLDALVARAAASSEPQIAVISGEPGMGKTTLLRAWTAGRLKAGDTVLTGACGPLDRSVPLDALFAALEEHIRKLDRDGPETVLGPEAALLRPLLGLESLGAAQENPLLLADAAAGPALLHAALGSVLHRLSAHGTVVVTIDDAHLAGPAFAAWLGHVTRSHLALVVVAAVRSGEGEPLPAHDTVELGPLDRAAVAELVGEDRVDALLARSQGHPLFLAELAGASGEELPRSLVDAISTQCDQLAVAAAPVRAAAVIGPPIDPDLLASVLHEPSIRILDAIELAARRGLLIERSGAFEFRHELVRVALAEGASESRSALLHREASRALAARPDADPIRIAEHARLGGDLALAATRLRWASARAADRFDPATAEDLLDQSLELDVDTETLLARARLRTLRGEYGAALADVQASKSAGAAALEVGAWASYFDRDFAQAIRFAADGAVAAEGVVRARCLMVGGRTQHARGDLAAAEDLLVEALGTATGIDRLAASAWLGVLRSHQSRIAEAIPLMRPATAEIAGFEQTSATLHALLFTGHAHALAGRPALALAQFDHYSAEVERRQVPRFVGRGVNFSGWVLRNLGEPERAAERHQSALEAADAGTPELRVAALEDLAEDRLVADEPAAAAAHLLAAEQSLEGDRDLVFGWRLAMKLRSLRARLALQAGEPEAALASATHLFEDADRSGVPRYSSVGSLLVHRARHALGERVDLDQAERDLRLAEQSVGLEAWWWAGETGAALGVDAWVDLAEAWVDELARQSGPHEASLRKLADRRLDEWRLSSR